MSKHRHYDNFTNISKKNQNRKKNFSPISFNMLKNISKFFSIETSSLSIQNLHPVIPQNVYRSILISYSDKILASGLESFLTDINPGFRVTN